MEYINLLRLMDFSEQDLKLDMTYKWVRHLSNSLNKEVFHLAH